jgi:hypothetical protein
MNAGFAKSLQEEKNQLIVAKREIKDLRDRLTKPGMVVDCRDHPPIGTRVVSRQGSKRGSIISNEGSNILVQWSDGKVQVCSAAVFYSLTYACSLRPICYD